MGLSYRVTGLLLHQEGQGDVFKMRDWADVCLSAGFYHWPTVGMFLSAQRPFLCSGGYLMTQAIKTARLTRTTWVKCSVGFHLVTEHGNIGMDPRILVLSSFLKTTGNI